MKNLAYIDGQNLHLGAKTCGMIIRHDRLRRYLKEKYKVEEAYYFLGVIDEAQQDLYDNLQKAGFILSFREHSPELKGRKKGNVDSDIIFSIMKKLVEQESFNEIILVSNDGDYKKLVDFLIKKKKFTKILFPNKQFASSLYKKLGGQFYDYLDSDDVRAKICFPKKKKAP